MLKSPNVTYVFQKLFGYSEPHATKLMLQVHNEGKAVVSGGECTCLLHEQHWIDEHNRAARRLVGGD